MKGSPQTLSPIIPFSLPGNAQLNNIPYLLSWLPATRISIKYCPTDGRVAGCDTSGAILVVGINGFLSKYITGHSIDQAPSDSSIKHYILIHGIPPSLQLD